MAHPSVQQYLVTIMNRDLQWTDTLPPFTRFLVLAALCILCPFIFIADFVRPEWKVYMYTNTTYLPQFNTLTIWVVGGGDGAMRDDSA